MRIGLDVGSTTVKAIVLDDDENIIYRSYERHKGRTVAAAEKLINGAKKVICGKTAPLAVTGSAGLVLAERLRLGFVHTNWDGNLLNNQF